MRKFILLLLFLARLFAVEPVLEIDDLYTSGSATGVVSGGAFSDSGWTTIHYTDNIQYDIRTAPWAKVEFDVQGLCASNSVFPNLTVNKNGDPKDDVHYTLFNSYDRDNNNTWMGQYMPSGVRQWHNPYKLICHLFGYAGEGENYKWEHGRFRLNVSAFEGGYDNDPHGFEVEYGPIAWEKEHKYHIVLEWGQGVCHYYIDDSLYVSCDYSAFGAEYAPPFHSLRIGSSWGCIGFGHQVPIGITFSNFKFWRFEDLEPPKMIGAEPYGTDVDATAFVGGLFNESLHESAATGASLRDSAGHVPGEWQLIGNELYFEPDSFLKENSDYMIEFQEIQDFAGNMAKDNIAIPFKTGDAIQKIVGLYHVVHIPLTINNKFGNQYIEVDVSGEFAGPNGEVIEIKGFWMGGNRWIVRMAPTAVGTWTFRIRSNMLKDDITGSFECIPSESRGFVYCSPDNPYTFCTSDGTPWLWKGDTSWRGFLSSIPYQSRWKEIIDLRAEQGYNMMQSIVVSYINGDAFWSNEGGPVFDLNYDSKNYDRINPYFFRWMDRRVEYANSEGIAPVIFFTWAQEFVKFSDKQFDRFAKYLVARYAAYNVVWVLCGEYNEAYDLGVSQDRWKQLGKLVKDADPYDHPISLHPSGRKSSAEFGYENWFDFVMEQTGVDMHQKMKNDRIFEKPVVNGEYAYAGYHSSDSLRIGVWTIYASGGFSTAGFMPTFAPDKGGWDPGAYPLEQKWIVDAYAFMNRLEWWNMQPHHELVENAYCLANPGKEYLIYSREGGVVQFELTSNSLQLDAELFHPGTGQYTKLGSFGPGNNSFNPDIESEYQDYVLYLHEPDEPLEAVQVASVQDSAESLIVRWDANTESDLAGYKVYYGKISGNYTHIQNVGNVTKYVITGLSSGIEYFVVLTAYDFAGNESELSDEISAVAGEAQFSEFDLNQDGEVDISDLILHLNDPQDYNGDGEKDISDLVLILNKMEVESYEPEPRY